jgi:1,2-diacylglycerol 3-beta-galactosyltransferase
MDAALPAALLIGGGEGVGPVEQIANELGQSLAGDRPRGQLVIICGRNRELEERLKAQPWRIPVVVKGFVDNMPDWMAACDCVVTKAGPGTIAEALISGLPILLSGYIPGQEEGNIPYVVDNGVGEYNTQPPAIAATVARWFGPERDNLAAMSARAKAMGHPQATFDIVRSITELLDAAPQPGSRT